MNGNAVSGEGSEIFHFNNPEVPWTDSASHLEAEQPDGVDDVILLGGMDGGQHRRHVVHADAEEEQEAQQMAPDIHRLIG